MKATITRVSYVTEEGEERSILCASAAAETRKRLTTRVNGRIRFVAVTQGTDTDESNPASKLLMRILAAVAHFERELIRERVSAGIKTAKAKGTKSGRAIGRPRVIVDRQRVIQLRRAGASWSTIGIALEVPSTTARRAYRESAPLPKTCARETVESMRKQRAAGD